MKMWKHVTVSIFPNTCHEKNKGYFMTDNGVRSSLLNFCDYETKTYFQGRHANYWN